MAIRIGDVGRAVTAMTPSGYVEVAGRRHGARSEFGAIEAGSEVVILRGDVTGFVVRKYVAGAPLTVPNSGEDIAVAAAQRKAAQVEEVDRRDAARAREEHRLKLHAGVMAAASLGGLVGLASACLGWFIALHAGTTPTVFLALVGGQAGVGLVSGVLLFVVTGIIGKVIGATEGEPAFAPSFVVIFTTLVGAAAGYWWNFETADAGIIALGGVIGAAVGGLAGYMLKAILGPVADFFAGS